MIRGGLCSDGLGGLDCRFGYCCRSRYSLGGKLLPRLGRRLFNFPGSGDKRGGRAMEFLEEGRHVGETGRKGERGGRGEGGGEEGRGRNGPELLDCFVRAEKAQKNCGHLKIKHSMHAYVTNPSQRTHLSNRHPFLTKFHRFL